MTEPQLGDFRLAILLMAFLSLGPVLDSITLDPRAGADTSGHAQPKLGQTQMLDDAQAGS